MADSKPNVAALIAQMPDTDQQNENPAKPGASGIASKFTGPDPQAAEKVFAEIIAGGRESILEVLSALRDPADADFKDYKAGYVLHGLCLYTALPDKAEPRRVLAEAIGSQLKAGAHSPAAKRILLRELQVAGGKESIVALGECLADEELCESAAQALLAIRDGVAEPLRKALSAGEGKNLVTIAQALGTLQDKESLVPLRKLMAHDNPDVRRTAAWALANTGDAESDGALLKFTDAAPPGWERTHATGLCHLMAERLTSSGQKDRAAAIYAHLRDTRKDPEDKHISESAARALNALQP